MTTKSNNNADTELLVTLAGGPMTFGRALKTIRECEAMSLGAFDDMYSEPYAVNRI